MKNVLVAVMLGGLVLLAGCGKKDSNNPLAPAPLPEATNVKFTMHLESGTEGMIFVASPSADIKLEKVIVTYPPAQFIDTVANPNPTAVFSKGSNIQVGEYTGVDSKQIWVLTFIGTDVATGKPFSVKMNWEVI